MTEQTVDVVEYNVTTGETIERSFTEEEKAAREALAVTIAEQIAEEEAAKAAREALKASAKAKLIAGEPLTAEEADILVI